MSLPGPPFRVSRAGPPNSLSRPGPPLSLSRPAPPSQGVVAALAAQGVAAGTTGHGVVAPAALDGVATGPADHDVGAVAGADDVAAAEAADRVAAAEGGNHVTARRPDDRLGAGLADLRRGQAVALDDRRWWNYRTALVRRRARLSRALVAGVGNAVAVAVRWRRLGEPDVVEMNCPAGPGIEVSDDRDIGKRSEDVGHLLGCRRAPTAAAEGLVGPACRGCVDGHRVGRPAAGVGQGAVHSAEDEVQIRVDQHHDRRP